MGCRNGILQNLVPLEHDVGGRPRGAYVAPGRRQQGEQRAWLQSTGFYA